MKKILDRTNESNGGEDIDEIFAQGAHLHIEKMAKNEYMVRLDDGEKSLLLFVGHWPKDTRKQGTLKLNITENSLKAKWHY